MRSGIVPVQAILAFLLYTIATFAFSVAGYGQSAPVASTVGSSNVELRNVPSNDGTAVSPAFPVKASANNRYLVDQNNVPFLIVGDAPQTLIANLSQREAAAFMANRRSYGINTLWINLLCNYSDHPSKDATTFDGIAPFHQSRRSLEIKPRLFPARGRDDQHRGPERLLFSSGSH